MSYSLTVKPGLQRRIQAKVATVDIKNRRVDVKLQDASTLSLYITEDAGHAFRWPKENEIWIIRQDSGIWILDSRCQQGQVSVKAGQHLLDQEPCPIESLAPGEMRLDASHIVDDQGHLLVAVDLSTIRDGDTLRWNATLKRFVAGP